MAVLQQKTESDLLSTYPLNADSIRIGRQRDCELFLDSKDVSRYHARIYSSQGRHLIEDLDSRNGTQVNGASIQVPVVLEDGDEVRFSSLEFCYLLQTPLNDDPSSGYAPSVFTLRTESHQRIPETAPVVVRQGDRISLDALGCHPVSSDTVVARVATGGPDGGWPTLKEPVTKLKHVLALQNRLRTAGLNAEILTAAVEGLLATFESARSVTLLLRHTDGVGFVVGAAGSRSAEPDVMVSLSPLVAAMESRESMLCFERETAVSALESEAPDRSVRYLLCAPMTNQEGGAVGALQIESNESEAFDPSHAELLAVLAHVVSCHLDSTKAASSAHGRIVMHRSAETADSLRRAIGPIHLPRVDGFQVRHHVLTVPDIAADLVDTVRLNDGRLACFILDVPGRGQQAAELMAGIASVVTRTLIESGSPADAIRVVEVDLNSRMSEVPLVTSICIAILDRERSTVTISVAGHCPAYHVHGETVQALVEAGMTGPPLGQPRDAYQDFEICLGDDDAILLCSDGIVKVPCRNGELVPQDRIHELLVDAAKRDRAALATQIAGGIDRLRDTVPLQDDVALLTIHKTDSRFMETKPFRLEDDWQAQ